LKPFFRSKAIKWRTKGAKLYCSAFIEKFFHSTVCVCVQLAHERAHTRKNAECECCFFFVHRQDTITAGAEKSNLTHSFKKVLKPLSLSPPHSRQLNTTTTTSTNHTKGERKKKEEEDTVDEGVFLMSVKVYDRAFAVHVCVFKENFDLYFVIDIDVDFLKNILDHNF
jgi:hypothetical protein